MAYRLYQAVLDIKTDISESIIRGDTLFGLLCVSILEHNGEKRLLQLLDGYLEGNPFAVISDSLPHMTTDKTTDKNMLAIPLATVPNSIYHKIENGNKEEIKTDRKVIKKLKYVTGDFLKDDYRDWLKKIHVNKDGEAEQNPHIKSLNENSGSKSYSTIGNLIDRNSSTTLEGGLFQIKRNTFAGKQVIYVCMDDKVLSKQELTQYLTAIGLTGYGANKSRGLGKFIVDDLKEFQWPSHQKANAYITLSPSALKSKDDINIAESFYSIETIFGKHGNGLSGSNYLKNPLTLISSHGLITPKKFNGSVLFIGNGLGGKGEISTTISGTVHQGYTPVIPIYLSTEGENE